MKVSVAPLKDLNKQKSNFQVFGVFESIKHEFSMDEDSLKLLAPVAKHEEFLGKSDQILVANHFSKSSLCYVALIGMGDPNKAGADTYRKMGALAFKLANDKRAKSVSIILPEELSNLQTDFLETAVEGFYLANYRFDKYITKNKPEIHVKEAVFYVAQKKSISKDIVFKGKAIADGVCLARDLINEGPWAINPPTLAKLVKSHAKSLDLHTKILEEKDLEKENMNLILAVGKAASKVFPPCLIELKYQPKKKAKKHVVLVGKGVTFDSGGLDIKPPDGMLDMKVDMSGAAAVFATMTVIAKLKPNVAVTGYMPCVENGIGPHAFHPGDVIKSRKGITVEINNTDAEGRLILADALDYAQSQNKLDYLIDLATLTGACMIALGPNTAGLFANDDKLAEGLVKAGVQSGEDYWRMPLNENLREQLKSNVADMKNTGTRYGGSITAALFLKIFINENVSWAHLDIAGPATSDKDFGYLSKGGVGFGVRTLVQFISQL